MRTPGWRSRPIPGGSLAAARSRAGLLALAFLAIAIAGPGCGSESSSPYTSHAPAAIGDLAAVAAIDSAVTLAWTAPGEPGAIGAVRYDVRYTTGSMDEGAWDAAARISSPPAPGRGGDRDSITVDGLAPQTAYRFAVKALGPSADWSPLSNVASVTTLPADPIPPDAITDLRATDVTDSTITVTWTAPGDDGGTGRASAYDLRYSTAEVDGPGWDTATRARAVPLPDSAGAGESATIGGLAPGTTYRFAIRAMDEVRNRAGASNVAVATTVSSAPDYWTDMNGGTDGPVRVLLVDGDDLIAGGDFTLAGGAPVSNVARWSGERGSWGDLGDGSGSGPDGRVEALAMLGGNLIAAGVFNTAGNVPARSIAGWNGTEWSALGEGIDGEVSALAVLDGLYAGGSFTVGDASGNILHWDGMAWTQLASGTDAPVRSLAVYDGALIASGEFTRAGGVIVNHVARWDGSSWSAMGDGTCAGALVTVNGELLSVSEDCVSRWNGSSWDRLAPGAGRVGAAAPYGASLVIASGNDVLRWDWSAWKVLGKGMNAPVYALAPYRGDLVAGGWFTRAGSADAQRVARWHAPAMKIGEGER